MKRLLLAALLLAPSASSAAPKIHEVQVVLNDTDSAQKVGPKVVEWLKAKGYDVAPKPLYTALRNRKIAKVALKLDVLKPATCFVSASAEELPEGKGFWVWQTKNERQKCEDQARDAVESFAAKRPPEKVAK